MHKRDRVQKSLQGWFPTRDFFFLKPRAGCYSAQAQRTVKGACLWWPFLSAWLPICTLHLWPDLAFQTLQAKHPEKSEKSLLVWPVFKRMACSMRELVEPLLPTSRWRTHRPSFIILLFLGKCVLQLGARRKYGQKSSRKPTILQLKGTNCTYLLALSARLLALAAFSLTPLNPVSRVFHQRTREQRFVVCFQAFSISVLLDAAPKPVSLANKDIWTLWDLLHLNCRFPSSQVANACVKFKLKLFQRFWAANSVHDSEGSPRGFSPPFHFVQSQSQGRKRIVHHDCSKVVVSSPGGQHPWQTVQQSPQFHGYLMVVDLRPTLAALSIRALCAVGMQFSLKATYCRFSASSVKNCS